MKRRWMYGLLLVLPFAGWLLHLGQFLYPLRSLYSDLSISHLPNLLFLRRSLFEWGQIPLWSNTIFSGYPFAANPLSGVWYPPGWLAIFFPQPLGLNLVLFAHLWWGGWGMFRFLESRGLRLEACWLGALFFALMPKLTAHLAAGHVTLIYALSWTPWLLWAERRRQQQSGYWGQYLLPAVILAAILLADVRWAAYAVLLWGGYGMALQRGGLDRRLGWLAGSAGLLILGILLAAPLLLPFVEYVGLSTRQYLTPMESFTLSLPPEKLLGLLIPDFNGYAEWILYPGAWALLSWVYHAATPDLRRRTWLWMVLAVLGIVYALGSAIPYLEWVAKLPGWGLMRVPSRAIFLSGFALAVLVADALQRLMDDQAERPFPDPFFFMTPLIGFVVLLSWGMWRMGDGVLLNFVWGAAALLVCGGLVFARQRRWLRPLLWVVILGLVCAIDLAGVMLQSVQFRSRAEVYGEGGEAAAFLSQRPGLFRVYSPSYRISQQAAAKAGLEFASGIDPMQLTAYVEYFSLASGVSANGYDVTLPSLQGETVAASNHGAIPDLKRLGLLNVRYLVTEEEWSLSGLNLVQRWNQLRIYENQMALPRAWVQDANAPLGEGEIRPVELEWQPNRLVLLADGPGLLVVSEVAYPGWRVWVDGNEGVLQSPAGVLRGVNLDAGTHKVEFEFRPLTVFLGMGISFLTVLMMLAASRWLVGMKE